jgi:hypothetical protein
MAQFSGNANEVIASATATLKLDTATPGGVFAEQGGGRRIVGVGLDIEEGLQTFALQFRDLPFIFGEPISITLRLVVITGVNTVGQIVTANATADYAHTMTWEGLTEVRDHSGTLLTNFSAISPDSGFDFARPVPEPSTYGLMLLGLFAVAAASYRSRQDSPKRHSDHRYACVVTNG